MPTRVLVIDDDTQFRRLLEMRLKSFLNDLELSSCGSLREAREVLSRQTDPFDLVLLDEHLGDGKGHAFFSEGHFEGLAVLSISSDDSPEIPGQAVQAGAKFFLAKSRLGEALFRPLILGLIERNRLEKSLKIERENAVRLETVRQLVSTLQHEINNPLGVVMGAAFLVGARSESSPEQKRAAEMIEKSGERIKHVVAQLAAATDIELVKKAAHTVFQIPGDKPWPKN